MISLTIILFSEGFECSLLIFIEFLCFLEGFKADLKKDPGSPWKAPLTLFARPYFQNLIVSQ